MNATEKWTRTWPALLGTVVVSSVGAPAAWASWRHATAVIERSGDTVTAPFLALSTDGMLLAALVVIWVRRHRGEPSGPGPWLAFAAGLAATVAANLAASNGTVEGYVVALWPPLCLAIALELVAMIAYRTGVKVVTEQSDPGPDPVETEVDPPVERSDEELMDELRLMLARDGKLPGREAVRQQFAIGSKRADRVRTAVLAEEVAA